jgi:dihydrodipicolinate synthase/N-acetylneuraminate lyase
MSSITGVYAAAVTPRRPGTQGIDLGAMWEIVDFLTEHSVDGIVLMGSTGEFVHYSNEERMRLASLAPKRSRVPVVINVSHSTLDGTVELARSAAGSGAAAVLVMPPYFFRYTNEDLTGFMEQFIREASVGIPILLYNIPAFTNPLPHTVAEPLLRNGLVQGIKDSSGDRDNYQQLAALRAERHFTFMMGNDALFVHAKSDKGVDGGVSGIAAAVPELLVALNRAIAGSLPEVVTRLELRLRQFIEWTDRLAVPVCIREAAAIRGLRVGPHAIPASEPTISEFREWFKPWLSEVQRECKYA